MKMIVYELTEYAIQIDHYILTWCVTDKKGLVTRSVVEASFTGMLENDDITIIVRVDETMSAGNGIGTANTPRGNSRS